MTPEQFVRWMEGFLEGSTGKGKGLTKEQLDIIRGKLESVLTNVTRERATPRDSSFGEWPPPTLLCDSGGGLKLC